MCHPRIPACLFVCPPACLPVQLPVQPPTHLPVHPTGRPPICLHLSVVHLPALPALPACRSVCVPFCTLLPVCPPTHSCLRLSVLCLSARPSVHLPSCLPVDPPSVHLSVLACSSAKACQPTKACPLPAHRSAHRSTHPFASCRPVPTHAAPCCAVLCRSVPCCAVPCRPFPSQSTVGSPVCRTD